MRKIFSFGNVSTEWNYRKTHEITLEIELKETQEGLPVFTASGKLWNSSHTDIERGGQCIDNLWNDYNKQIKNKKLFKKIMKLWQKYHLNDINAWCEHQNWGKDTKTIKIHHLTGNEEYEKLSKLRQLPPKYIDVTEEGLKNIPRALYDYSAYKIKNNTHIETKRNTWVEYDEIYAPEGLLGKVCPVCGAKHGHGWYYMPILKKDLEAIKELIGE